jgi:hypothetical protein
MEQLAPRQKKRHSWAAAQEHIFFFYGALSFFGTSKYAITKQKSF